MKTKPMLLVVRDSAGSESRLESNLRGKYRVHTVPVTELGTFLEKQSPKAVLLECATGIQRLRELAGRVDPENVICAGRMRLDLDRVEAKVGDARIPLGPVEFKILSILARNLGRLRSRAEIEAFVWGEQRPTSRALDPHINSLRKKLLESGLELRTVYRTGYSLCLHEATPKVL
jgi:DNA-binding response OmpR family regulator